MTTNASAMRHHYRSTLLRFGCLLAILGGWGLSSCQSGPSAQHYARRLCDCSEDFSKAPIQLKAGTIDRATFEQLQAEHDACMGDDDPLEDLKDDPEALQAFKVDFLTEVEKQCPTIARNLGY